ncbi:MAG: sigma-70 family RNA polymerase sigma factor [Pirellulales bacterium]
MKDENVHPYEESRTSTSLLRGVKAGEQVAWRDLVNVYSGRVFRWAKKAGLNDADAADLLQATFAKVFRALPEFRRDREGDTFGGWLRRIATHAIIDARRKSLRDAAGKPSGGTDHHRRIQECGGAGAGVFHANPADSRRSHARLDRRASRSFRRTLASLRASHRRRKGPARRGDGTWFVARGGLHDQAPPDAAYP